MSTPRWPERDDALDAMLAALGTPEAARPVGTSAEILGRAALLAPPVVGLTGFRLAAVLALAVGGGFLGGLLVRWRAAEERPPVAELSPAARRAPAEIAPLAPVPRAETGQERGAGLGWARRASRPQGTAARETVGLLPDALARTACPTPAEEPASSGDLTPQDLAAIAAALPETAPAPAQPAPARAADEDALAEDERPTSAPDRAGAHPISGSLSVGAVLVPGALPGVATGVVAQLGVQRLPAQGARSGGILAADLSVGLLAAAPGARWTGSLALEAGRAWRLRGATLDAGWTLGARLVLPATAPVAAQTARAGSGPLVDAGLGVLPLTGPKVGLTLGQAGSGGLRLDLATQLSPGAPGKAPQPWISLSVGSAFPFSHTNKS